MISWILSDIDISWILSDIDIICLVETWKHEEFKVSNIEGFVL
jgi:hypothetical protein